jgi:hypothetical protein
MPASPKQTAIAPRKRVAKGPKRPEYLQNPELDKFMMMFTALLAEVSALRDRIDTYEALAKAGQPATTEAVEAYALSEEQRAARETRRDAMLGRVFRILLAEQEAARGALSSTLLDEVLNEDIAQDK